MDPHMGTSPADGPEHAERAAGPAERAEGLVWHWSRSGCDGMKGRARYRGPRYLLVLRYHRGSATVAPVAHHNQEVYHA